MSKNLKFDGTFNDGKTLVTVKVPLWMFEDDGTNNWVLYCPFLDLSGYGNTELEAKESFKIVLGEFLQYTLRKKTFEKELKELGWTKTKKKITAPHIEDVLARNENAREIANNIPFTQSFHDFAIPQYA